MSTDSSVPFNPEICFDTPVGRICLPITSSPTFPLPPSRPDDSGLDRNWAVIRGQQGEISRATSRFDACALQFTNRIERRDDATTRTFRLSRSGETFLTLSGRAYHDNESAGPQCARRIALILEADGTDWRMTLAQEGCSRIRATVERNGATIERTLDVLSLGCAAQDEDLSLCQSLNDRMKARLEPFADLLRAVGDHYWRRARHDLAQLPTLLGNPGGGGTAASIWCGVARAGCWGLAAAGGAACCGATAGVGCILCAGGFGAAGSGCSEAWSWC